MPQDGSLTIVAVYFLLACGSSPFTFFGTDMMGVVVYHGDPDAASDSAAYQSYAQGVRTGSLAFLCMGVVDVLLSVLLPLVLSLMQCAQIPLSPPPCRKGAP